MKDKLKGLIPVLSVVPFIIGTFGYIFSGDTILNSMYASFALYFVNPVSDEINLMIEIARWTSPLVTTSIIVYSVNKLLVKFRKLIAGFSKNSIAIYSDVDIKIKFTNKKTVPIYCEKNPMRQAKSHIIMMNSDTESLGFYEKNKKVFKDRNVYIGLKEIDCGLIRDCTNVDFYDIDGAVARSLWKEIALWKNHKSNDITISILGNEHLGQNILNYGILLNLFSLDQHITYNFIGEGKLYEVAHGEFPTMNCDKIKYISTYDNSQEIIKHSDIVIISKKVSAEQLSAVGMICEKGKAYYYAPDEFEIGKYIQIDNLIPFGKNTDIYTDENICKNRVIEEAMTQHYNYLLKTNPNNIGSKKEEWDKLSGFNKQSNISSTDFKTVLKYLGSIGTDVDIMAQLEHIRWCRFNFINYWQYGIPNNGTSKDSEKRIHKCLCDFYELDDYYKNKDYEIVEEALK